MAQRNSWRRRRPARAQFAISEPVGEVVALSEQGRKIEAIRRYRQLSPGVSLSGARKRHRGKHPAVTGTVPGQEPAALMAVIAVGLLIFIPLVIYLCLKTGLRQTIGLFTIGIWPSKRRSRQQPPETVGRARHDR